MLSTLRAGLTALAVLSLPFTVQCDGSASHSFPPVDLGYAVHVPTYINKTTNGLKYANYNNIRFAHPPLGPLRFRRPKTPPPKQQGVQDGSAPPFSTSCVSAIPNIFPDLGLESRSWGSEDCLFLNVRVPKGVKEGDNVPVIHWVYGSAYSYGSKDFAYSGDGAGVFDEMDPKQQYIYVASNYRMGLFGWSSSPSEDMEANVGMHDTLAALRWTQKYISKFGGDPQKITALGESAGAGMINLLLTAKGGREDLPFSQAYIASPGVWPRRDPARRQDVYDQVLKAAKCTSVSCLRKASEKTLFDANAYLLINVTDGHSGALGPGAGFCPVVDSEYIKDLLPDLLSQGKINPKVKHVAVSNMAEEGRGMGPEENVPELFPFLVRGTIPGASDATVERIRSLYTYPPELPQKLAWDWVTDISFACNAYFTAKAYKNKAQRYVMTIPPANHALDQSYYFFLNNATTPVANVTIAREFQEHVRRFVTGHKNNDRYSYLPDWPKYGPKETIFDVTLNGFESKKDFWEVNQRCQVLREIIGDPENGA